MPLTRLTCLACREPELIARLLREGSYADARAPSAITQARSVSPVMARS